MSPWEIRAHVSYLTTHTVPHPLLDTVLKRVDDFIEDWAAVWAQYQTDEAGWDDYLRLRQGLMDDLTALRGCRYFSRIRSRSIWGSITWSSRICSATCCGSGEGRRAGTGTTPRLLGGCLSEEFVDRRYGFGLVELGRMADARRLSASFICRATGCIFAAASAVRKSLFAPRTTSSGFCPSAANNGHMSTFGAGPAGPEWLRDRHVIVEADLADCPRGNCAAPSSPNRRGYSWSNDAPLLAAIASAASSQLLKRMSLPT